MLTTLLFGFSFDYYGRRSLMFVVILLTGILTTSMPLVAPSVTIFLIVQVLGNVFADPIMSSPIIQDYVFVESRGKGVSLAFMGIGSGIIVSQQIFVRFTID
jgi:MFS family permease